MSDRVHIVEVGPRDGLQNEKTPVSVADRIAFIEALIGAGLTSVEVGAFVSPKAIPQMVGSAEVLRGVSHHTNCELPVLVPNEKGYEASQAAGAKLIAVFAAASESFSRANINCSIAELIDRFGRCWRRAKADGVRVRGYISTVLGCPYEGEIKPQAWSMSRKCCGTRLLRSLARRHHRRRHALKARHCCGRWQATCRWPISPCISTTPTARRSPISMPGWRRAAA